MAERCPIFSAVPTGNAHIAEGTDHLLFLLVLLLPAPLLISGCRWRAAAGVRQSLLHILSIVTAFTIGHSLTLSLAAMNLIRVPGRPIEVLIAVSILVSAIHALRPIFPGREAWIAAFFGLIHGLAFAATLDRLGLSRWDRVAGIMAFNLGIETMQIMICIVILPSLLLISRTSFYSAIRTSGAVFGGVASIAWIAERLVGVHTPVDTLINAMAGHGLLDALALFGLSLACRYASAGIPSKHSQRAAAVGWKERLATRRHGSRRDEDGGETKGFSRPADLGAPYTIRLPDNAL